MKWKLLIKLERIKERGKCMKFLEEKFVPLAAALGSQRHLVAIRDAFIVIMP